jgi:hypothetical protein
MATAFADVAKPLTEVTSWKSKAERNALVEDIRKALTHLPVTFEIDDQPRDVTVIIHSKNLHADIWIGIDETSTTVPIISWFKAAKNLKAVPGAWTMQDINSCHHRKATSSPTSFNQLIEMLVNGFTAAQTGRAFSHLVPKGMTV